MREARQQAAERYARNLPKILRAELEARGRILDTPTPERYPCAMYGCDKRAVEVRIVDVKPNGMPKSVAFYGYCAEHC